MAKWKLYWVESDGFEDCFVVAKNSRSAAYVEISMNGFDKDMVKATRIMGIPDEYEKIANDRFREWSKEHAPEQVKKDDLCAWPDYARKWLLSVLGAQFRNINGEEQTLLQDRVYGRKETGEVNTYDVGVRALQNKGFMKNVSIVNDPSNKYDYQTVVFKAMGLALSSCHEIEYYISHTFLFAIPTKQKNKYETINDLIEGWKNKTLGYLIRTIQEAYDIEPTIKTSLDLFLDMRNNLAHELTVQERFNIQEEWGQKELLSYLDIFLTISNSIRDIFRSCYITGNQFANDYLMPEDQRLPFDLSETIQEDISVFTEFFRLKD